MGLLDGIFGKKQEKSLDNISSDDLQTERYTLEEKNNNLSAKIGQLEKNRGKLFEQGATPGVPTIDREMLAIKMVDLEERMKDMRSQASVNNVKLQVLTHLVRVKQSQPEYERGGVWSVIMQMTPNELEDWALGRTVINRSLMDKLLLIKNGLGESSKELIAPLPEREQSLKAEMEIAAESKMTKEERETIRQRTAKEMEPPSLSS